MFQTKAERRENRHAQWKKQYGSDDADSDEENDGDADEGGDAGEEGDAGGDGAGKAAGVVTDPDAESEAQLRRRSFTIKKLVRLLHVRRPVEPVMAIVGKK